VTNETARRIRSEGWNACLDACIAIVCPVPHVEEERTCEEIRERLEALRRRVEISGRAVVAWGSITI
jgi:hypothetical protein